MASQFRLLLNQLLEASIDLFEGLKLGNQRYPWELHPLVIYLMRYMGIVWCCAHSYSHSSLRSYHFTSKSIIILISNRNDDQPICENSGGPVTL